MKRFCFCKKDLLFKKNISNAYRWFNKHSIIYLFLFDKERFSIGECNTLFISFEEINRMNHILNNIPFEEIINNFNVFPYFKGSFLHPIFIFGLEQMLIGFNSHFPILYHSPFTKKKEGLSINDILWLHLWIEYDEYKIIKEIEKKIIQGFSCFKIKMHMDLFDFQYKIIKKISKMYPFINVRMDANGCFKNIKEALYYLNKLYDLRIVSLLEQPILPGSWKELSMICKISKLPISLDEELIGVTSLKEKKKLLDLVNPKYLVIRPSLHGGFMKSEEWIIESKKRNIKWYVSSSFESSIGMNAIAQWTYVMQKKYFNNFIVHHGLNTLNVYKNESFSLIEKRKGLIWYI
ncbi:enolase C-terminal domain-like protein [Blattabacterium cuenoti]|uniref:enolase C-terminal domain-like protein n=1 Tax=Blattabacterium cuenoti TaxID=1653831 RepID=UPI00163C2478|nr:enolase C-terminal domain-like protein [Blattabacterium cuenoti]